MQLKDKQTEQSKRTEQSESRIYNENDKLRDIFILFLVLFVIIQQYNIFMNQHNNNKRFDSIEIEQKDSFEYNQEIHLLQYMLFTQIFETEIDSETEIEDK